MGCCETSCDSECSCDCHGFTSAAAAGRAGARLSRLWDRARDMEVRAGLRPYTVSIVRARASGMRSRGDGPTDVVAEWKLLPTPKVADLSGIGEILDADQLREQGSVMLSGISRSYSEDMLLGRGPTGAPVPAGETVFFEVRYLDIAGRVTQRMRFVAASRPSANVERAEWTISLQRAPWDRGRDGVLR